MGADTAIGELAVVGVDDALHRRLLQAAPVGLALTAPGDPLRYAADARHDPHTLRGIIIGMNNSEEFWDLLLRFDTHRSWCPITVVHQGDEADQLRALAAGVAAVMSREAAAERIIPAVIATLHGDAVISVNTMASFAALLPSHTTLDELNADERRWLQWLADGRTVNALADHMGCSTRQMRRRLAGLYLRLGVANRDQAVALTARLGPLDPPS